MNRVVASASLVVLAIVLLSSDVARAQLVASVSTHVAAARAKPRAGRARAFTTSELLALHAAYEPHIREAAALYQLPVALLQAVVRVESGFDRYAVSRKAAAGLTQLMPFHVRRMRIDPTDPRHAILAGARLLRELANRWDGDLVLTLASYNAGAGAVQKYRGVPPFVETRRYVARVLRHYEAYRRGQMLRRR